MIKLCRMIKRRDDMSKEDFKQWWLNEHAVEGKKLKGLRRYQLCFTIGEEEYEYDGMAEMWFDSVEAANAAFNTDLGRWLASDAIAHAKLRVGMTVEENVVIGSQIQD